MFELKITIGTTPDLGTALNRLADALSGACAPIVAFDGQSVGQAKPAPVAPAPVAPAPVAQAPVAQAPVAQAPVAPVPAVPVAQPAPTPAVPVAQAPAPVPAVPVAQTAPTYTKEQVASAGAALIQARPETRDALIGLLTQFGVNAINNLPDEHLGAFATALRGLGANI